MKQYVRKVVSFVSILALVLSSVHLRDVMEAYAEIKEDWRYEIRAGEVEITRYNGNDKEVVIPDSIGGKKVTSIGERAFLYCSSLKSITIPESVKSIGVGAFEGCRSLKSITMPKSIKIIGNGTFFGCSSLKSITIPESVKSIGMYAFFGCSSLKSIIIPESVKSIGMYAFEGCSSLKSITIPKSVKSIGEYAFTGCSPKLVFCCSKGSCAAEYAKSHNIKVKLI